jgi:hypothetical protein
MTCDRWPFCWFGSTGSYAPPEPVGIPSSSISADELRGETDPANSATTDAQPSLQSIQSLVTQALQLVDERGDCANVGARLQAVIDVVNLRLRQSIEFQ